LLIELPLLYLRNRSLKYNLQVILNSYSRFSSNCASRES